MKEFIFQFTFSGAGFSFGFDVAAPTLPEALRRANTWIDEDHQFAAYHGAVQYASFFLLRPVAETDLETILDPESGLQYTVAAFQAITAHPQLPPLTRTECAAN